MFDSWKGSQVLSQNRKTTIVGCWTEFFFWWKKKLMIELFGVKFTGDYHNVAIIPTVFRDHRQKSKNRIFHRFFDDWPWSRNNYVMISTTWLFPVNFTPKNYTSKLNFEKKIFLIPERGLRLVLKIGKRRFWDVGRNVFFFFLKKIWF